MFQQQQQKCYNYAASYKPGNFKLSQSQPFTAYYTTHLFIYDFLEELHPHPLVELYSDPKFKGLCLLDIDLTALVFDGFSY